MSAYAPKQLRTLALGLTQGRSHSRAREGHATHAHPGDVEDRVGYRSRQRRRPRQPNALARAPSTTSMRRATPPCSVMPPPRAPYMPTACTSPPPCGAGRRVRALVRPPGDCCRRCCGCRRRRCPCGSRPRPWRLGMLAHAEIIVGAPDHNLFRPVRRMPDGARETAGHEFEVG